VIYAPDGRPLAQASSETAEELVIAELDLGMISLAKAAADPAGHYSRPDVTRLMFNPTPGDRVLQFAMPGVEVSRPSLDEANAAAGATRAPAP
jgi:aliphatic nitrilase